MKRLRVILAVSVSAGLPVSAQQNTYFGAVATGELVLSGTVNLQSVQNTQGFFGGFGSNVIVPDLPPRNLPKRLHPPVGGLSGVGSSSVLPPPPSTQSLTVVSGPALAQFNGVTHMDQRFANAGNQFSVEPPNPSVAAGGGFVLEGVNNAIEVYSTSGTPLLPRVISSNELFGLPAAINRNTGSNGVFPTDMRVFFDPGISRWFVLQRAQDNDTFGNPLNSSHLYLAVSQTSDPTTTYNIYIANTTNGTHPGCPCLLDFPGIGADQYGFYISANEFNTFSQTFVDASILAISKGSLASGAATPTISRFFLPFATGFEFTVQPATTPPGASYFLANGGLEYFASTVGSFSTGASLPVWAMVNTSSRAVGTPNPTLIQISVPTLSYGFPSAANQPDGPRPYGASLTPPGPLPFIDGADTRVLSVSYSGGRLYVTFATNASDQNGRSVVGGAYVILSPTFRGGTLAATVLKQGYLVINNNHILRPSIAVDAQGRGAISATVVGPNWYPSAAFIPMSGPFVTPTIIQIAQAGSLPEDGFTGYSGGFAPAAARWGDYSSAVVAGDGSVWMVAEYIGNLPRSTLANWDTFVMSIKP
jgi:hypothetical protein